MLIGKVPSKGWEYHSMVDDYLENTYSLASCEYCDTKIRYIHLITHPSYEGFLHVGCCCADRLCATSEASEKDAIARRLTRRLDTLLVSPRWRTWKNGSFIEYEGYDIRIWEQDNGTYQLQISWGIEYSDWDEKYKTRFLTSKFPYTSFKSAVIAAFRTITDGSLDKFIEANRDKLKKRLTKNNHANRV